jgi:hypothetical protein
LESIWLWTYFLSAGVVGWIKKLRALLSSARRNQASGQKWLNEISQVQSTSGTALIAKITVVTRDVLIVPVIGSNIQVRLPIDLRDGGIQCSLAKVRPHGQRGFSAHLKNPRSDFEGASGQIDRAEDVE